jgi:PQQ-dependent catabolism-associated CXXCW motif protein
MGPQVIFKANRLSISYLVLALGLVAGLVQCLGPASARAGEAAVGGSPGAGSEAPRSDVPGAAAAKSEPAPEPDSYKLDDYRSPVPETLKGAKVLSPDAAADLWNTNGATFIDVFPQAPKPKNLPAGTFWRDTSHRSIEGAHWLPNVGYGALPADVEAYMRTSLEALSKGNRAAPLVFFCLKDCWMSWNAAKRALDLGYTNVMWFRDGTDGWQELGYPLVDIAREPQATAAKQP